MHAFKVFLTRTVLPAALIVGAGYNIALTINGPDGRLAAEATRAKIADAKAALSEAQVRTAHLSRRADGLMTASLDEDLFEERLRARLGLTRPGEYMVRMQDLDEIAALDQDDDGSFELAELERGGGSDPRAYRR